MLTLYVDVARWSAHHKSVLADLPGLVPVAKGNGYGFGVQRLAGEAAALGAETLAVGTYAEARQAAAGGHVFQRLVVLTPYLAGTGLAGTGLAGTGLAGTGLAGTGPTGAGPAGSVLDGLPDNTVHTAAGLSGVRELAGRPVVVECRTSLRRHGIERADLAALAEALPAVRFEGFALHLPLARPQGVDPAGEVAHWVTALHEAGLPTGTVYVSHLTGAEVAGLTARFPDTAFRPRVGTRLWLGDRAAFQARARVLDVVPVSRGERYGYRQRRARAAGHLVVVAGGTAHGVGLEAPKAVTGGVQRAKVAAIAGLAAVNRTLSPFRWAGRQRWFAEPPHMQVSLLWLPGSVPPPAVGDELPVEVRMTTTHFDAIVDA